METPTGSGCNARPPRTATPRLSERKRQLFRNPSSMLDEIDDDGDVDDPLLGIAPLKGRRQHHYIDAKTHTNLCSAFDNNADECVQRLRSGSSTSSSPDTNKENKKTQNTLGSASMAGPEEQLPHLFTTTMRLNSNSSSSHNSSPCTPKTRTRAAASDDSYTDTDDCAAGRRQRAAKRIHKVTDSVPIKSAPEPGLHSPQYKLRRTDTECIPTVAFYSHATSSRTALRSTLVTQPGDERKQVRQQQRIKKTKVISPKTRARLGINKGVRHKIPKPLRPGSSSNLDGILSTLRNEKLRKLITSKREERAKVEQLHEVLRSAKDPIKMAKPLSVIAVDDANNNNSIKEASDHSLSPTTVDFSDLSEDEEMGITNAGAAAMELEPVIPLIRHSDLLDTSPNTDTDSLGKRKFFKSGRRSSTCMEVRITDNIRASVRQGKIELVQAPPRKRQVRVRSATIFSAEQATVDAILRNLDETVVDEIVESVPRTLQPQKSLDIEEDGLPPDPFAKYRQQLPYQTEDPVTIEQQAVLLEFLISNNICTDENFKIFIGDPENHKDEATDIVDKLFMVVNAEQQAQDIPESNNATAKADAPQAKLFPIFTERLQPLPQKSSRRKIHSSGHLMAAATGASQYQIDAGQKAFGARQCQQCGLVYSVHEPEEEQLHHEYHNAVNVLRFKGWIDEDIVAVYPDWSTDGRIIRLNEKAPAVRLQRLTEVIRVVDKELGFSSYIVPKTFIAYFAVRKQHIVGMCLVQPLTQAHRFIRVDGTDYLGEEIFEASCGVSRIWVSPLHRRQGIASKLLRAVQCHTILGSEISRDRIAFSTPTDDGRAVARHFTQNENFLTYDQ